LPSQDMLFQQVVICWSCVCRHEVHEMKKLKRPSLGGQLYIAIHIAIYVLPDEVGCLHQVSFSQCTTHGS